jgi:hypothetical protein
MECDEWKIRPNKNPRTGRAIKNEGKIYRQYLRECGTPDPLIEKSKEDICNEWLENPLVHPITGKFVKPYRDAYESLSHFCGKKGREVKPDFSGSIYCDRWRTNPLVHPFSHRRIKECAPSYKYFKRVCARPSPELCDEWLGNPLYNPYTNRPISRRGKVFRKMEEECGPAYCETDEDVEERDECAEWRADPLYNPLNGRMIVRGGPTYRKFERLCGPPDRIEYDDIPEKPAPKKKKGKKWKDLLWGGSPEVKMDFIDERVELANQITYDLSQLNISKFGMCLSGENKSFKGYLSNISTIGQGSFGQVYRAKLNGNELVVKEVILQKDKSREMRKKAISKSHHKWTFPKKAWPEEYTFLNMIKQLVFTKKCPNFLISYHLAACEGCVVDTLLGKKTGDCFVVLMEPATSTLVNLVNVKDKETQESLLYQILAGLYALQKFYQIQQNDIKLDNVLIKNTPHLKGEYFDYVIYGEHYYVKNTGYTVYLSDFGVAKSFSPLYATTNFYGTRNAEVIRTKDGDAFFEPITAKRLISPGRDKKYDYSDPLPFPWEKGEKGTFNQFYGRKDIGVDRPVDLNDVDRFPPFEFFYDIQNVIRMFLGGRRTGNYTNKHYGFRHLNDDLRDRLLTAQVPKHYISEMRWSVDTVPHFLASYMLKTLYVEIDEPKNIIGTYNMV